MTYSGRMISGRRIGEWFRGESHFGSVGQPALRGWLFLFVPLAILSVSCSNSGPQSDPKPAPSAPSARILQFYASASEIERGEPATLCYGVENARSVRLEPAVEKLTPALSRCFIVTPRADASYKLIVAGENGAAQSQSVTIRVKERARVRVQESESARVTAFRATPTEIRKGETVTLCFETQNAEQVELDPPVQRLGSAGSGCFALAPAITTTYTLTAKGKGSDRKQVSVAVNP